MNISDLMWYLSEVPMNKRRRSDLDFNSLTVYHVTSPDHVESIQRHGISAKSCQQSYERQPAAYVFADRSEINAKNLDLLGFHSSYAIVQIDIPAKDLLANAHWDALYNVTFGTSRTALQYRANIPARWVRSATVIK